MSFLDNINFPVCVSLLALGAWGGYLFHCWRQKKESQGIHLKEEEILRGARQEAETLLRESRIKASEESLRQRSEMEAGLCERAQHLQELEKRLVQRESLINTQMERLLQEEQNLLKDKQEVQRIQAELARRSEELACLKQQYLCHLQSASHLDPSEARSLFLKEIELASQKDAAALARNIIDAAKSQAEEKARRIISIAIQRYASEYIYETSTATVSLPGDEIKGRIIGREGRNIRAFEAATGVTVLIDDTPNAVVLSGFDPVRREIAREAMQRLVQDGRIHPTRIEEVVKKVSEEMDETILKAGHDALIRTGLSSMAEPILQLLGRLRFRLSFSQNILDHSVEVAHLTGLMAAELGLDVESAKRAGLLHDIGKAVGQELEGSHALIGAEYIKRHGESEVVVNAVASHHDEVPHHGPLGVLVGAADAISASRPGARSETITTYIKRVETLERIAASFPGVEKSYAIQAGREIRVLVHPDSVSDEQAYILARNLARKIEDEMQYPGQVRVTVVRETRCIEYAK